MASTTNQQISIADFLPRPWTVYSSANQDLPSAYRQPKFRWTTAAFENEIFGQDAAGNLKPQYHWARLFSAGQAHARYLANMSDSRNRLVDPNIDHVNLLRGTGWGWDGLNLDEEDHARMFEHLQQTLNFIFMDGLYPLKPSLDTMTVTTIGNFLDDRIVRSLQAHCRSIRQLEEIQSHRLQSGVGSHMDGFEWIDAFTNSTKDAYQSMSAAWEWASVKQDRSFEDAMKNVIQDVPEMTRLLLILLERENSFEDVLIEEHVFGCLYDKRIRLLSPTVISTLWNRLGATTWPEGHHEFSRESGNLYFRLGPLYRRLTDYQMRLQELFDYKYLMEWHYNKRWDKLYVVINPSMKDSSTRHAYMSGISDDTIKKFLDWSKQNGEIANNVFGVHPILKSELEGETCSICLDGYDGSNHPTGVLVMKLLCNHYFHPKCIISAWDAPCLWDNRCPLCRSRSKTLRDIIDFDPEWEDVDYGDEDDHTRRDTFWRGQMGNALFNVHSDPRHPAHHVPDHEIPINWAPQVMDAFWRPQLEQSALNPYRAHREANRPSWESVLGA